MPRIPCLCSYRRGNPVSVPLGSRKIAVVKVCVETSKYLNACPSPPHPMVIRLRPCMILSTPPRPALPDGLQACRGNPVRVPPSALAIQHHTSKRMRRNNENSLPLAPSPPTTPRPDAAYEITPRKPCQRSPSALSRAAPGGGGAAAPANR